MRSIDWEDNPWPLAYLITFRTYGTWLHGDERYSMDRRGKNIYGTPAIAPNRKLVEIMESKQNVQAFLLDGRQRAAVETAIKACCDLREWALRAINVRTNHAHATVSAARKPEGILNAFKANSTRELRSADWFRFSSKYGRAGEAHAISGNQIMSFQHSGIRSLEFT